MGNDNKASLASLSCFGQNANAYNFLSNKNMTLKLHIIIRLDTVFLGILSLVENLINFPKNYKAAICEYGVWKTKVVER